MLSSAALKKTGTGWEFVNEAALEDFVWDNLKPLLNLTSLKRQYFVRGEICDILAVDDNRQLVVLELKNTEDRYIVQQLTRYYDALLEVKPFDTEVDYGKPIRLIAIAPIFHKHNEIDRKHHNLVFDFLKVSISKESDKFYLHLHNADTEQIFKTEIFYREIDFSIFKADLLKPSQIFLNWLSSYNSDEQEKILKVREQILSFDKRMQEVTETKSIKYGRGKTKPCAEFCFERKSKKIVLFLWLPIPNRKRHAVGRMQIGITDDYKGYWGWGHQPDGIGKMEVGRMNFYHLTQDDKWIAGYLDEIVDEALETWIRRL